MADWVEEQIVKHEWTGNVDNISYGQILVRCKNCKHGELKRYGTGEKYACIKSEYEGCFFFHDGDWFCADGEHK